MCTSECTTNSSFLECSRDVTPDFQNTTLLLLTIDRKAQLEGLLKDADYPNLTIICIN